MCKLWPSCNSRTTTTRTKTRMKGSSESARKRSSDSSRELNTSSRVSNIYSRLVLGNSRIGFPSDPLSSDYNNNDNNNNANNNNRVLFGHNRGGGGGGSSSGVVCQVDGDRPFTRAHDWLGGRGGGDVSGDVSLREWLDRPERAVEGFECLHVFRQIVEMVDVAHSQGIVVHGVRPSCFVMSAAPFNRVSFIESASASCSDSSSGSDDDKDKDKGKDKDSDKDNDLSLSLSLDLAEARQAEAAVGSTRAFSEASCMGEGEEAMEVDEKKQMLFPMKQVLAMETSWYTSPEEENGGLSSCASDVYRLGVLLFELFCPSSSREEKSRTMSSLRHRVLPMQLLLKWPKEASFCLWLLHPEPTSRPKLCELLQSEFLNAQRDDLEEREAAIELRERIEEQDLLLEFLLLIQQRKQETAEKLQNTLSLLSSDIDEVTKHQSVLKKRTVSCPDLAKQNVSTSTNTTTAAAAEEDSASLGPRRRRRRRSLDTEQCDDNIEGGSDQRSHGEEEQDDDNVISKNSRLMKNFKKLEAAYFMTRCRPMAKPKSTMVRNSQLSSDGRGSSAVVTERSSVDNLAPRDRRHEGRRSGWISPFLEGLCKYLSFSKLRVKADLKQGDLLNSSNLVCSLSFDRDGEFFATAGVNKKIKVFECDTIMKDDRDIHYPVVEMSCRSKLSSICWNSYIKSQIASSNFEGVVQVWDVTRSQVQVQMREHEKRVWSIDFSSADPTLLASGSDDGSVKLWSINQGGSIGTIRTKANVCCVQFPLDSGRSIAFGSADHKIYYYDLRNAKVPLCTLVGHNKTVSYVKFVDSTSLVSASTDNTVKLWDLSTCTSRVIDSPVQTYTGHTNVKNFVGLSVSDGYIATGSETNEVFIYHKAFPMPALSFKFNNADPLSGHEMDETAQFISSVCWRGQSNTLVAANSTGNIKILEMV